MLREMSTKGEVTTVTKQNTLMNAKPTLLLKTSNKQSQEEGETTSERSKAITQNEDLFCTGQEMWSVKEASQ